MAQKLHFPLKNIAIKGDRATHSYEAYDFAWFTSAKVDNGPHPPLYACADGVVKAIINKYPDYRVDAYGYGNYIIIQYDNGYSSLFAHILRNSFVVKVGEKVKQGQKVCQMDNSGHSLGNHLHLEICKGTFRSHGGIDALTVMYATPDVHIDSELRGHKILIQNDLPISPVERNIFAEQIQIKTELLRVRKAPSLNGEILGFAEKGFYFFNEIIETDNYSWAKIGECYIALTGADSEIIKPLLCVSEKNDKVDQFEVIQEGLRIRENPSTASTIFGSYPIGFYDVSENVEAEGLTWYRVGDMWAASSKDWVVYHPKKIIEEQENKNILYDFIVALLKKLFKRI